MKPITIFTGASGLNTVDDPTRVDFKSGVSDLQVAVNIEIDQSLRVTRRKGQTLLQSGVYHSLFHDGGGCYVGKAGSLYQVGGDFSLAGVRSGMTNDRISYAQANDKTYYCNGVENGYIFEGVSYTWSAGTYSGPTTDRVFVAAPVGNHLDFFAGRMFVAEKKILWWSELHRLDLYDLSRSLVQFDTDIRMVKHVDNGLFVSTQKNVWFLQGINPKEFKPVKVSNFPAIEWSDTGYVDGFDIGLDPGLCVVWASKEGAILGTPNGQIMNLNKDKIIYPDVAKGFGCLNGYQFLHGMGD